MAEERIPGTPNIIDISAGVLHIYNFEPMCTLVVGGYLKRMHPTTRKQINTIIYHSEAAATYPTIGSFFSKRSLDASVGTMLIKNIIIEPGFKEIGSSAFSKREELEHVVIPDTITTINQQAFYGCKRLTNIEIPANIQYLGAYAFALTGIKEFTLYINSHDIYKVKHTGNHDNLIQPCYEMFRSCFNLKKLTIKATVFPTEKEHKISLDSLGIVNDANKLQFIRFAKTRTAKGELERLACPLEMVIAPKKVFDFKELYQEYKNARGIAIYENVKVFED